MRTFFSKKHREGSKGFTLIELLVVISIISLISSIILTNISSARKKALESSRKTVFRQIQLALETYRTNVGSYPVTANYPNKFNVSESGAESMDSGTLVNAASFIPGLVPTYISSTNMPGGTSVSSICTAGAQYATFLYMSNGTDYKLVAVCTPEDYVATTDQYYDVALKKVSQGNKSFGWRVSNNVTVTDASPWNTW